MRLLLVLLAMLTGLSLPELAVATSPAEVAGVGAPAAGLAQAPAADRTACRAPTRQNHRSGRIERPRRIWLPVLALACARPIEWGDRARE